MRRACSTGLLALELTALPWLVASLLAIPGASPGAQDGGSPATSQSRLPPALPAAAAAADAIATPFAPVELAVAVRVEAEAPAAVSLLGAPGWLDGAWREESRLLGLSRRQARAAAAPEPARAALLALGAALWAGLRRIRHGLAGRSGRS